MWKRSVFFLCLVLVVVCVGCGADNPITPEISNMAAELDGQGRLILSFDTNLPDGTAVNALIMTPQDRTGLYMAGSFDKSYEPPKVKDGHYAGWFPTASKRGLEAGPYIMLLSLPPNQEAVLGKGNQRLQGVGVKETKLGKGFKFEQRMELPEVVGAE